LATGGGIAYAAASEVESSSTTPLLPTVLRSQSGGLVFSVHLVPGRLDSGTFARHVSGTGTYNSFDHGVALRLSRTPCKGDGTPVRENTACSGEDAASLKRGHVTVAHLQGVVQGELITASTTTGPRLSQCVSTVHSQQLGRCRIPPRHDRNRCLRLGSL
jgi:hypothetical protein